MERTRPPRAVPRGPPSSPARGTRVPRGAGLCGDQCLEGGRVDHAVGIVCSAKRGQTVEAGQILADVHARDEGSASRAARVVLGAYEIGDEPPPVHGILLDVVE